MADIGELHDENLIECAFGETMEKMKDTDYTVAEYDRRHTTADEPDEVENGQHQGTENYSSETDFGFHFMVQSEVPAFEENKGTSKEPRQKVNVPVKTVHKNSSRNLADSLSKDGAHRTTINSAKIEAISNHLPRNPFACIVCDKRFDSPQTLQRHEVVHREVKKFKCDVCHKRFNQPYNLRTHMVVHTKEKPYECEKCGKQFSWKVSLKGHYQRYHGGSSEERGKLEQVQNSLPDSGHQCPVCGKSFKVMRSLTWHMQTHSDKTACPVCDQELRNEDFTEHLLTHYADEIDSPSDNETESEEETYTCHLCNKMYATEEHFKFHLRSHGDNQQKRFPFYRKIGDSSAPGVTQNSNSSCTK